jgi:putative ABC transport system permease protein
MRARPGPAAAAFRRRITDSGTAVTGTGAAASLALAILVLICSFVAVAVPRASLGYRTQVLQRILHGASSASTTVLADADIAGLNQGYLDEGQLDAARGQLLAGLRRDSLPLAPPGADWSGMVTGSVPFSLPGRPAPTTTGPPQLELLYRSGLARNARLAAGSLPGASGAGASGAGAPGAGAGPGALPVAVTEATAARFGLHVGSRLQAIGQLVEVTGILRPVRARSSFWTADPVAGVPQLTYPTPDSVPYWSSAAFVGAAGLPALQGYANSQPLRALWSFPLDLRGVPADQAAGLLRVLQRLSYLPAAAAVGTSLSAAAGASATIQISLSDGLVSALPPFVATDDAVQRVLTLLFVPLAAIAAVVVLLGARLVAEHRRGEFTMMRARGASLRQLATAALAGGAAVVLPAAAAGIGAAVLATPGPGSSLAWWLAALIIVAALAGPPLLAVWWYRTRRSAGHAGSAPATRRRITAARRWVADAALAGAAAAGLIVLRQQGLPPPGQVDVFTSAAPVLAAIPVALLIMRAYPVALRWLARLTRRRRGVVLVVGFARGRDAAQASLLPAFALVLAFAVIAFAAMARGAVARADVAASWSATGADALITAPAAGPGITPAAQRAITGRPGVQRSAAVSVTTGTSGQGLQLTVVIVDPARYAALAAATPGPGFPAAALARPPGGGAGPPGLVPALISPAARAILSRHSGLYVAGRQLRIRVAGTVTGIAGAPAGSQFAVVPRWALGNQDPVPAVLALVGPRLDQAALSRTARRAVPGARVTLRSNVLAAISDAPLPHGGFVSFAQGAAAAAAFSLLVLALTLVLSSRSRDQTLARLATMGLEPAQSRRIMAVEMLPAVLAAAVGGIACALVLVPLVGPAVNLAAFTGVPVNAALQADPEALMEATGALLLLAGLTLLVQDRLARRRGTTQALRVGE